jgi:hypothetical protein
MRCYSVRSWSIHVSTFTSMPQPTSHVVAVLASAPELLEGTKYHNRALSFCVLTIALCMFMLHWIHDGNTDQVCSPPGMERSLQYTYFMLGIGWSRYVGGPRVQWLLLGLFNCALSTDSRSNKLKDVSLENNKTFRSKEKEHLKDKISELETASYTWA